MLVGVLVGGIVGTTSGMLRATKAEARAIVETKHKTDALDDARDKLFMAQVNRARAERSGGRVGQRFGALKAVREAAQIRMTPELRTEAIAALMLPDAELAHEWDGWPEGTEAVAFAADLERYARLDGRGAITVCRLVDGREEVVHSLPPHGDAPFHGLWVSPDGRYVAYGHSRTRPELARAVRVWKLDGPAPSVLLDIPGGAPPLGARVPPRPPAAGGRPRPRVGERL